MMLRAFVTRVTLPMLVVLVMATGSQLQAQFFGDANGQDMQKQLQASLELQKKAAENRIESRISDIDRACQLSDAQKQKLSIAAKGAVKAHMRDVNKSMIDYAKEMGIEFDPDAEPEDNDGEDEVDDEQAQMQAMMAQEIFFASMFNGGNNSGDAENNKVWKSAVKKVLDEGQSKKWKEWLDERNQFQRRVAVEQFIAKADRKLLLSPEQRTQLTAYIDEKHGKKLCDEAIANDGNQFGMNVWLGGGMVAGNDDDSEVDEELKKILSESQLDEWQKSFAPQFGGMGAGGGFGAFNVIGGAMAPAFMEAGGVIEVEESEDDK